MIRHCLAAAVLAGGLLSPVAAQSSPSSDGNLAAKLPEGVVKKVLERLPESQRAAVEAAANYEVSQIEQGQAGVPAANESQAIEKVVGARLALLVAANAFEGDADALAAWDASDSSDLRAAAMAPEVAKTGIGRRLMNPEALGTIHDLLRSSPMVVMPRTPCGEGLVADIFRLKSCVTRSGYRSVVGIAWTAGGQREIYCTGQVIAPRMVLTADHCFDGHQPLPTVLTHFTGGNEQAVRHGISGTVSGLKSHRVKAVRRGTTTNAANGLRGFDVAVVELEDDIGFTGFPRLGNSFPAPPKMTVAGWGRSDASLVNAVALEVTVVSVQGSHLVKSVDPSLREWPATLADGGGLCGGDSGGPIFAGLPGSDAQNMQLIGLVAGGNENCRSGRQAITDLTRAETIKYICDLATGNPYCRAS